MIIKVGFYAYASVNCLKILQNFPNHLPKI